MMPLSSGWRCDVVFLGKKHSLMFDNLMSGWLGQLSRRSMMCLILAFILLFKAFKNCTNFSVVIHARWLFLSTKALGMGLGMEVGCLLLPITHIFSYSPVALQHNKTVNLSFSVCAFVPWGTSPSQTNDLLGTLWKNMPVSSTFQMSFKSYPSNILGSCSFHCW